MDLCHLQKHAHPEKHLSVYSTVLLKKGSHAALPVRAVRDRTAHGRLTDLSLGPDCCSRMSFSRSWVDRDCGDSGPSPRTFSTVIMESEIFPQLRWKSQGWDFFCNCRRESART